VSRRTVVASLPCNSKDYKPEDRYREQWAIEVEVYYNKDRVGIFGGQHARGYYLSVAPRGTSWFVDAPERKMSVIRVASGYKSLIREAERFSEKHLAECASLVCPSHYLPLVLKVLEREKDLTLVEARALEAVGQ
jgi:hypothetical protein